MRNKDLKTVICEDDEGFAQNLRQLVTETYPEMGISVYSSGEAMLLNDPAADLYLLDLDLPGMNGLTAAKRLRKKDENCTIIFITGYDNKMPEAFDVQAHHYLLKPLNENKFKQVFESAVKLQINNKKKNGNSIVIKANGTYKRIYLKDIKYVDCFRKKITLHTVNGDLSFYKNMNELERYLNDDYFRCHRGVIVNLAYVQSFTPQTVTLTGGCILNLSRRKFADFENAFLNFIKRETIC